ncbi:MAG TPA: NAD(P)H-binding protein [Thermomicrobiales bacterium]|nr:NAD(P)H-binding protein [Thermomicrobiales bacterium]
MITIMGATGNTGSKIAMGLLEKGHPVRAIGRSPERLAELKHAGAEVAVGDSSDAGFLVEAFRGTHAVYTLLPTDRRADDYRARQSEEGEAIAFAIRESGVRRVVALSCLGADVDGATGVIQGLREQEERLRKIKGIDVCFLRPVSFFENFYDSLESVRQEGVVIDSVESDLEIPMVAARDVAHVAVEALADRTWSGVVIRELIGPRDISYREATRILGEHIGRPDLQYVQLPYDEMAAMLVDVGLSESFALQYVEMTRSFNEGIVVPRNGRTAENSTPTTFEAFSRELAEVYLNTMTATTM